MKIIWKRIEYWLSANSIDVLHCLNPPATERDIAMVEARLQIAFPQDVRESLMVHNGQNSHSPWLLDGWELLSLQRIEDEWGVWQGLLDAGDFKEITCQSDGHTVTDWWHPKWIPLTYDGAGNHHCLDLIPGQLGQPGQIIRMWHDDTTRDLIASSYRDWLQKFATELENGHYQFSREYNGIVRKER